MSLSQEQLREEYEMSAPSTSAGPVGITGDARPMSQESREALSKDKDKDKDDKEKEKEGDEGKEDEPKEKPAGLGPYFVSPTDPGD